MAIRLPRLLSFRGLFLAGLIATIGVLAAGVLISRSMRSVDEYMLKSPQKLPAVYTGIVPGARVYKDGRLSHMLEDRVVSAAQLYKAGKIKKLLLTGDHGNKEYDEVKAMRLYLRRLGVPESDIFLDHAGFTTYDSLYRARDIFGVNDCVVVTQEFHLPRSVYTARKLGLNCYGFVADRRPYTARSHGWSKFREFFSKMKAWLQVNVTKPKPKFLGDKIPITGDARLSRD